VFVLLLWPGTFTLAAAQQDKPDKEMIQLLELLQQWDLIKDLDLMRELSAVEADGERAATTSPRKEFPATKKEIVK
jgi:hypothetical protein